MKKIILEIFDKVNIEKSELIEMEKDLTEQVEAISKAVQEQMPREYHDDIDRHFFEVSGIAERTGFELGMKFMVKLLIECLS
mgnify:CR=1 FL=1